MKQEQNIIKIKESILDYDQTVKYKHQIMATQKGNVTVDFSDVKLMTTAAFAELIKIKAVLLEQGRDMQSVGLHDQPKALCEILKLCKLTRIKEKLSLKLRNNNQSDKHQ